MAAAGVGDDVEHDAVVVGTQAGAGAQVGVALFADGVHGAVALGGIIGAVEQCVGGLVSFEVEDAQGLAGFDHFQVVVARADGVADAGVFGFECAFFDHGCSPLP